MKSYKIKIVFKSGNTTYRDNVLARTEKEAIQSIYDDYGINRKILKSVTIERKIR